ncbi:flavodoxin domain-containing protein [Kutzneria viridogrisea]|uniref:Flavodoxin-like domain-containing protein n=2 Tax=Kutzneria TaxID=43356 RepID=W5W8X5_9PSEU|nr:flavodoxin domain-containing protein [Kutzneria albida]AHH97011.1 hypothetical protein KALB_3647 [Kutzneria albida DSM 43870]MBA8932022.1 menaquinone-dependent protoporphyrinogen oxidase [Kutzneria viridogrisea]
MTVLVGYASEGGSTEEIAEHIAADVSAQGHQVLLCSADRAPDPAGFQAVVLGSAIHNQAWLPEAISFLREYRDALGARPVWLFGVGLPGALHGRMRALALREKQKVFEGLASAVHPEDCALFTGVVRPEQMPWWGRLAFRAAGGHFGDFRDWAEIARWTDTICARLAPVGG